MTGAEAGVKVPDFSCARLPGLSADCAVACGKKAVDLHPYLHAGRFLYAQALEFTGQMDQALEEIRLHPRAGEIVFDDFLEAPEMASRDLHR